MDFQIPPLQRSFKGSLPAENPRLPSPFEIDLRSRYNSISVSGDAAFLLVFQNDTMPYGADFAYVDAQDLAKIGMAALLRDLRRYENLAIALDTREGQSFDAQWPHPAGTIHSPAYFTQTEPHLPPRFRMRQVYSRHDAEPSLNG